MAASESRTSRVPRAFDAAASERACPARPGAALLLDFAIGSFVNTETTGRPPWLGGPLVVVTPAADRVPDALADRVAAPGDGAAAGMAVWAGPELGRALGLAVDRNDLGTLARRLTGTPRCVVTSLDRIGRPEIQFAFVQLFDAAVAAGTSFCVTLAHHPLHCSLEPPLVSRLSGGLVVCAPPAACTAGSAETRGRLSLRRLLTAVARHHDLTLADLVGPSRCRSVAEARSVAMYLARHLTDRSLYAIGTACGGRDHTTVLHGVRVIDRRLSRDHAFAAELARLSGSVTATAVRDGSLADASDCREAVGKAAMTPTVPSRHFPRRRGRPRRSRTHARTRRTP